MPIYEYTGFDAKGNPAKGLKEAETAKAARMALRREGILTTDIAEASKGGLFSPSGGKSIFTREVRFKALRSRISTEAMGNATRQLAVLLSAGVPMVDSLTALIEQIENENLKRIFSEIKSDVNDGASLAASMEKHKAFSSVYVNLVRAGETSGAIEIVLERLADFLEGEAELKSKIISAVTYPAVMAMVSVGVLVYIITSVIPQLAETLMDVNQSLPLMTRILLGFSDFISTFWWLLLILFVAGIYGFSRWKKSPSGRPKWHAIRLRLFILGNLTRMVAVARFARTLSTLLASGVPLLKSLEIVRNVVDNDVLERAIDNVRDAVREGEDIATPLKRSGQFPPAVAQMIAVGEKTGELEKMLTRIAINYERRVTTLVDRLTSLLQPVLIIAMGLVALLIVGTIFSAMSGLTNIR